MASIGFVACISRPFLAARFGRNRLGTINSDDRVLANRDAARREPMPGPPHESLTPKEPYPTLAFIEHAIGQAGPVLTTSPHAPALECRARDLAREYWSDSVWTTGAISAAAFRRMLDELEPETLRSWGDAEERLPNPGGPTGDLQAEPAILNVPARAAPPTAA